MACSAKINPLPPKRMAWPKKSTGGVCAPLGSNIPVHTLMGQAFIHTDRLGLVLHMQVIPICSFAALSGLAPTLWK